MSRNQMCARLKNPGRGTSKTLDETAGNLPNTVVFRFDFLKSLQDCIIPDNCDICVAPPPLVRLKCASSPGSVYFRNLAVSTVAPGLVRPAWTCGCIIDVQLFIYSSTDVYCATPEGFTNEGLFGRLILFEDLLSFKNDRLFIDFKQCEAY